MTDTAPVVWTKEVVEYVRRCLNDTGFVCRNLCGWNYDDDGTGRRTAEGTGGVRDSGAHKEIVDMLDDEASKYKLLEAPRGSYKSTITQGYITRQILRNPNVRILYGMKTDAKAREKAMAIRSTLEDSKIAQLFGEQKGERWEQDRFTVATRTQKNLQEPTLSTFSLESLPTGGHYDFIIVDDLIDHENCKTPESLENARKVVKLIQPLLVVGGTLVFIGTRYDANDIYATLERNSLFHPPLGITRIFGAGVRVVSDPEEGLLLYEEKGGLTFPHLTLDVLRQRLKGMSDGNDFFEFSCQYLNVVPSSINSPFLRENFKAINWESAFAGYTGYLLTDTATSLKEEGCMSVIAYVLLDAVDNVYVADLRCGHWRPPEFVSHFFDVLEKWHDRVNHAGEVWEDISLVEVFETALRIDSRDRKIRRRTIKLPRAGADSKHRRILRLEPVFRRGGFYVLNTVPEYYTALDGEQLLFHPRHYRDARGGAPQPDGELVRQFVEYRPKSKCDIADTVAMILETDRKKGGDRYCRFKNYLVGKAAREAASRLQYSAVLRSVPAESPVQKDWWDTLEPHGRAGTDRWS